MYMDHDSASRISRTPAVNSQTLAILILIYTAAGGREVVEKCGMDEFRTQAVL